MTKKECLIIACLSIIIAIASLFQTLTYVAKTPNGFVYPLVHNYEQDFYWYLSLMRQGWEGHILLTSRYTPEFFSAQFVNTFFPVTGMIAHVFGLSLPVMYTILRVIGGGGLLFVSYMLLKLLRLPKSLTITGWLLVIFGSPLWFYENGQLRQAGEFWTGFDPIFRITWLPHHTMANVFFILSLIMFFRLRKNTAIKHSFFTGLFSLLATLLNPASCIIYLVSIFIGLVILCIQNISLIRGRLTRQNLNQLRNMGLILLLTILPVGWLYIVQNSVFPWTAFRDWERFVQYPVDGGIYLQVLGITGILGFIGIPFAFRKKDLSWNVVIGWFLAPFLGLLLFTRLLPISNGRFLQTVGYIPAAILAILAIWEMTYIMGKLRKVGFIFIISALLIFQLPAFSASISRQEYYINKNLHNSYVMIGSGVWQGIQWLSLHGKDGNKIIAPVEISTLIPAFSSYRVIIGHPTFTYKADEKRFDLDHFYQTRDEHDIKQIIDTYSFTEVWAPDWWRGRETLSGFGFKPEFWQSGYVIYGK